MNDLIDLTNNLIAIRKKPTTQDRFKQYPQMLARFRDLVHRCEDIELLKQVIKLDSGYYLLAGDRQMVLEKLLDMERTPALLRTYAMQLELFGDVDDFGEANLEVDARVQALYDEADTIDNS
jgi:hypothetical protein